DREFINQTINSVDTGEVAPIFILGSESGELEKELKPLRSKIEKLKERVAILEKSKKRSDDALEDFCSEQARQIKRSLLGSQEHANYNKNSFSETVADLKREKQNAVLTDEERKSLETLRHLQ